MAYTKNENQIIQEVSTEASTLQNFQGVANLENILVTVCNHYDAYDQIDIASDMPNWSIVSSTAYSLADSDDKYAIEDQTFVWFDPEHDQVLVHKLNEAVAGLKALKKRA